MPNLRPSNVAPVVAIPPGVVDLARVLAEELPARVGAAVNPRRVLVRSFLHHVNAAAECERRRLLNKGRGWERAELRATAAKAKHLQAASGLLPLVQAAMEEPAPDAPVDARAVAEELAGLAARSAVTSLIGDEDDGEVG